MTNKKEQLIEESREIFPKQRFEDRPKESEAYYIKADAQVFENWLSTAFDTLLEERDREVLEVVEELREDYKHNKYFADYGTPDEKICHDDGYSDALNDLSDALTPKRDE